MLDLAPFDRDFLFYAIVNVFSASYKLLLEALLLSRLVELSLQPVDLVFYLVLLSLAF